MPSPIPLPALVGPPFLLEGAPRERWLDQVRAYWLRLIDAWRAQQGDPPAQAAAIIDQLLGLLLLTRFVRDRQPEAIPAEMIGQSDGTPQALCQAIREATASPVLQAVFDPIDFSDGDQVPRDVWQVAAAADLRWRDHTGSVIPLPPTAFGEFHQLCLAERDAGDAGERCARGVHYTPVSLADYLTARVLDRLLESHDGRTPLRILDPSCGGGTFLLAAFRRLLQRQAYCSPQETLDLLGASLFGIDIDPRAVAWTRRALLLTAWDALLASGDAHAGLRVPDLSQHLVSGDFLDAGMTAPATPPELFHAILGGPPFVRIHQLLRADPGRVERYRAAYRTTRSGQFDLFMPFFEEAIRRLVQGGWLGWSSSSTFLRTASGRSLRSLLGSSCTIHELTEFEDSKIYPDAVTQIVLVLLEKGRQDVPGRHAWITGSGNLRDKLTALWSGGDGHPDVTIRVLPSSACRSADWSFGSVAERSLLTRIQEAGTPLAHLPVTITQGLVTGADPVFLLRRIGVTTEGETLVQGRSRVRHLLLESALLRPVIRNRDIRGYDSPASRTLCLTPYDGSGQLIPEEVLRTQYPQVYRYLLGHRDVLSRRQGIGRGPWYALRLPSCLTFAAGPRVLLKLISSGGDFTMDCEGKYLGHAGTLMLRADQREVDPFYLLGVLNSRVFWFFVRQTMPTMGRGRHVLRRSTLRRFPLVVSRSSQSVRQQIAEAVRELLAKEVNETARLSLLAEVERLAAELYGIGLDELLAPETAERGETDA